MIFLLGQRYMITIESEALHKQVRIHVGREPSPSAAIIDSQSVKTASKGGIEAMTQARRYQAENAVW